MSPQWPDEPVDVETLAYQSHSFGRPGILTALAVCSIVFGSLAFLYNGFSVVESAMELGGTDPFAVPAVPTFPKTSADTTAAGSLGKTDITIIADALAKAQPLNDEQRTRLEDALSKSATPIGPPWAGVPWTEGHVDSLLFSSESDRADDSDDAAMGVDDYIFWDFDGNGSITLWSDSVVFVAWPMDGSEISTTVWVTGEVDVDEYPWLEEPSAADDVNFYVNIASFVLALLLSICLIIAGVLTLRDRRAGRSLHCLWAWLRITLGLADTALVSWNMSWYGRDALAEVGAGESFYWITLIIVIAITLSAGLVYPIITLVVLRSQPVKDWYESQAMARPTFPLAT